MVVVVVAFVHLLQKRKFTASSSSRINPILQQKKSGKRTDQRGESLYFTWTNREVNLEQ